MKLLRTIIDHWGNVDSVQLKELVEYFPSTPLVIKWGMREREIIKASEVAKHITEVEENTEDWVREVFINAKNLNKLREVLGEENETTIS